MLKITLEITLALKGPLLTQASDPGKLGVDAVIARNHEGKAYIPGTLVSGKLRQAWEELQDAVAQEVEWFQPKMEQWLGKRNEYGLPMTKRLVFSDFILTDSTEQADTTAIRERIKIDPERVAVSQSQLVMIENPFISGQEYCFTGYLHFFSPSQDDTDTIIQHVQAGLKWLSQLGALRSVGFGKVVETNFTDIDIKSLSKSSLSGLNPSRIGLCIEPQYSFCISGKQLADNIFESETIIPGGAVLGSIATTWNHLTGQQGGSIGTVNDPEREELKQNFNKLRITHAFPSTSKKRPVVAPLSLVKIEEDGELYDVARVSRPCLINNKPPDFALDWKDTKGTLQQYSWPYIRMRDWGWDSPETELRIRTAINQKKLRSEKNKLFAYNQIIPDEKKWSAELDLSRIDKNLRSTVLAQFQSLIENGIIGLGKTKTPVKITYQDVSPFYQNCIAPDDTNQWVIILQTDSLLGSPEKLNEISGREELEEMYKQAWNELSNDTLILKQYFARQKLSGGRHRQKTLQNNNELYKPWLLTEAGSVFVLQANDAMRIDISETIIQNWLEQGLPVCESACKYYNIDAVVEKQWQDTPFIPQNGYGEIAVNIIGAPITSLQDSDSQITLIGTPIITEEGV